MERLSFEPLIPPAVWLTLAAAAAALLAWYALHRPLIVPRRRWFVTVAMMAIAIAILLVVLLNPMKVWEIPPPPGKPLLTVLVDTSASMATPDAPGGKSRYESARQLTSQLARDLSDRFDVRVRAFAGDVKPFDDPADLPAGEPQGMTTDLAAAISSVLDQDRTQGQAIALLSDGIDNAGGASRVLESVRMAKALAVPIYTKALGGEVSGWDLALELRSVQSLAIVGQKIPLTARVSARGIGTVKANVVLSQSGNEIARQDAQLQPGAPADVHFMIGQEKIGVYPYEVRVEPIKGESSLANNSASYVLRVVDEPIRVLVLEGKPYWDCKFLVRTLATDPAIAVDSIVRVADGRFMRRTLSRQDSKSSSTPTTEPTSRPAERLETWKIVNDSAEVLAGGEGLKGYQIVVLGRDAEPFLTEAAVASLQNWIAQQGGSLVCYRGSPTAQIDQKLGRLLPVKWTPDIAVGAETRFHVKLTDQGREMKWFADRQDVGDGDDGGGGEMLARLPSLATAARVGRSKPLAVVLASAMSGQTSSNDFAPAVVYQPYGTGRVVVIEGAGMWRWAFLAPQYQQHEHVYASLWHSLMRWLTSGNSLLPGQTMSLRGDKVRFATNEPATVTLLVREGLTKGKLPAVELIDVSTNAVKSFAPAPVGDEAGLFRVNFGPLPEGHYRARIAGSTDDDADASRQAIFDVRSFGQEQINLEARPDLMARIASDSGGGVLQNQVSDVIATQFKAHMDAAHPPRLEKATAWDKWWALAGVFGLWALSWSVRRSGGLV